MCKYWLVGAMWGGHDDQSEIFIRRGYWFLGWSNEEQPAQNDLRDKIEIGDRVAIKRMLGQGSPNVEINALGIVIDIDNDDKRIYINWLVSDLKREVPSRGAYASIHGPYQENDDWVKEVFYI